MYVFVKIWFLLMFYCLLSCEYENFLQNLEGLVFNHVFVTGAIKA